MIQQFCHSLPRSLSETLRVANNHQQVIYDISLMILHLVKSPVIYHPSKFWTHYMMSNIDQLKELGIENFKRTVNLNYFNWISDAVEEQLKTVIDQDVKDIEQQNYLVREIPQGWTDEQWKNYETFLKYFWEFAKTKDRLDILQNLEEPTLGNPLCTSYKGLKISQDICNSVLEINAATQQFNPEKISQMRIAELGGGYGRIAQVILQAFSGVKVTLIDIPPALFIAQWYLSKLFPDIKIFLCQDISDYESVKEEFEEASISFLLPHQIEHIPDKMFDLFLNVSSLQEMTIEQIEMWFNHIDRVCSGNFYSKQWYHSQNDFDKMIVHEDNYPVKPHWQELYKQTCPVQTNFFEALYKIP